MCPCVRFCLLDATNYIILRACSEGEKLSRSTRKHFDKFTSEILPCYSVYATKFHPDVFWPQCKDNVKWVSNFFYRSSSSCFFLDKFRFELTSRCVMYFKTTQFLFWKMSNKIANAICQLTISDLLYVSATFGNLTWIL